jgi:PST family polysaccharide transporter
VTILQLADTLKKEETNINVSSRVMVAESNLMGRTVSSTKWSAASQLLRQLLQFISTLFLARVLLPSDFGLMGMVMVVVGFVGLFKDLGTSAAVIQKREVSEELLSSIFWVNAGFGLFALAILYLLAPAIAVFYHEPRVGPILRLMSFSFLVSGLSNVHQAILERGLEFEKLARLEIVATSAGVVVGVGAALNGLGVWSLVFQTVAVTTAMTVMLWSACRWKPTYSFSLAEVRSVSGFSLNLAGFSILNYFVRTGDCLLIGRFLGAQQLGYYTLAYSIMFLPLQSISSVVGRVMLPVYSQMQDDHNRFQFVYLKIVGAIALLSFPLMLGLWALVEPFILFTFGAQWQPAVLLLIILVPIGMIQSLGTTVGSIYQAKGRTDLMFRWILCAGPSIILAFVVGLRWGIVGVTICYAIASVVLAYPNFAIPFRLINLSMVNLWWAIRKPLLNSVVMFTMLYVVRMALPGIYPSSLVLLILVPLGCLVYLITSWYSNREQLIEIWTAVKAKT